MKRLLYHIVFCCLAACCFTACEQEDMDRHTETVGDGNRIILDLASASLPVTRDAVTATGAETAVSHLDVLIFNQDETKKWYERISISKVGKVTLSAKRSKFEADTKYWVYLIANSTAATAVFEAQDFNLTQLKGMTQEDERIHVTGLNISAANAPQTFLMDGIAYPIGKEEPKTSEAVVLNNGNKADDTELQVTLRRAAAKIVVNISHGTDVEFGDSPSSNAAGAGYYLRNMPYSTSVIAPPSIDAETAKLRTPDKYNGPSFFNWTKDKITVTSYAYAHVWDNASTLEKEVRLIVNIPMLYTPHNEDGQSTGDSEYFANSYYQIPVSKAQKLDRNTCYQVNVTVNAPGGSDPSEPLSLTDISYAVYEWEKEQINVGGETDLPAFLTLNEYEMEMHNMADDNTTLEFASSSEVTATIGRVYYIDKFGQEKELTRITNGNPDEWGENIGSSARPNWKNRCTIKITPDKNINGKIHVHGEVPGNNAVRYIEFTVTNEQKISRKVMVAQYPLTYITNVEGDYSYRDDFESSAPDGTSGLTTWLLLAGKNKNDIIGKEYDSNQRFDDWITSCSWSNNRWNYGQGTQAFFVSKVAQNISASTGLCQICYYSWEEQTGWFGRPPYSYNIATSYVSGLNNHRMYHVTITATSDEYTLGRPRITGGKTDPGADNAVLVSPSFMLASQLGAVLAAKNVDIAARHCEQYVEVARDGTVYDDWRLPTKAEVNIIYKYQNDSDAMDEVLSGDRYWSASGLVTKPEVFSTNDQAIRCIRDAYDKKTGK